MLSGSKSENCNFIAIMVLPNSRPMWSTLAQKLANSLIQQDRVNKSKNVSIISRWLMTGLCTVQSARARAGVTAFMTNTAINCKVHIDVRCMVCANRDHVRQSSEVQIALNIINPTEKCRWRVGHPLKAYYNATFPFVAMFQVCTAAFARHTWHTFFWKKTAIWSVLGRRLQFFEVRSFPERFSENSSSGGVPISDAHARPESLFFNFKLLGMFLNW